jgi:tRNA (guanine-N7-)-methyltransferase
MSFGLSRGRDLDPGTVEVLTSSFPALPDDLLARPEAGFLDINAWFPSPTQPLEIEIGSGKGSFILGQAESQPGVNHLGIEYAREFFVYAADRVRRRGLPNVRMLCTDAVEFMRWRVASSSVSVIHLYYSDPWPKKKHHKNRVIQDAFLEQSLRVLIPGGELRVVTDHDELWAWDMEHFTRWTTPGAMREHATAPFELRPFIPPSWVGDGQAVATNYEKKMCDAVGKQPHACVLRKPPAFSLQQTAISRPADG